MEKRVGINSQVKSWIDGFSLVETRGIITKWCGRKNHDHFAIFRMKNGEKQNGPPHIGDPSLASSRLILVE